MNAETLFCVDRGAKVLGALIELLEQRKAELDKLGGNSATWAYSLPCKQDAQKLVEILEPYWFAASDGNDEFEAIVDEFWY